MWRKRIALKAGPSAAADNSTIIGNTLVNTRGGITTSGYDPISGLTIIRNSMIRTDKWLPQDAEAGIHLKATSNSTIASNVVTNAGGQGIILDPNSTRNVLSGNVVRNSGQHQANAYPGIQVTDTNTLIIGNESYNAGSSGMTRSGADVVIQNNQGSAWFVYNGTNQRWVFMGSN